MNTNKTLMSIMSTTGITQGMVAQITRRSRTAVYYWTRPEGHGRFAVMHPADLRLLQLELGMAKPQYRGLRR